MLPSTGLKKNLIDNKDHYKPMVRNFMFNKIGTYAWIVNSLTTTGCLIAYFLTDGKELVLSFYIPLDFLLNVSKAAFYFMSFYLDKRHKAD